MLNEVTIRPVARCVRNADLLDNLRHLVMARPMSATGAIISIASVYFPSVLLTRRWRVNLGDERIKREALMHALAEEYEAHTVLDRGWLGRVDFGWGAERVIDINKGIWNPGHYAATLTIISDPASEYDDGDHGDSLYRYSYERQPDGKDPRGGSNRKLREAMRLQLPIIMLRKIAPGRFVPVMPVYLVAD